VFDGLPRGASGPSVRLTGERQARILLFAGADGAVAYARGAERLARAQGGRSADTVARLGEVVAVVPRGAGLAERASAQRCAGAG
jgi:hypothetical protein